MLSHRWIASGATLKALVALAASALAVPADADPADRWASQIAEASSRFALPADWVRRVMRVESGGHLTLRGKPIVSRAGAMGLMQLMPGTWRDMRALLGLGLDPHDPRDNILAGTLYLRLMYDRFGYPGLFAAYNAGPARYSAHLSAGQSLPAETRAYVASVARPNPVTRGTPTHPAAALFAVAALSDAAPVDRFARASAETSGTLFVQLGGALRP